LYFSVKVSKIPVCAIHFCKVFLVMNKVFVGSLSWNVDEEELGNFFSQVGDVEEAKVITDRETGRSRGFGFVTFVDAECAKKAIEEFDGVELDGRAIAVKIANQRREGGGSGGGRPTRGGYGDRR
jgi:cold-inducible RNA-binding protein